MQETPIADWQAAISKAIDIAGGKTALMRKLNERGWDISSHNVIGQWVENGTPAKYCPDIEDETGVSCERLCPDFKWDLAAKLAMRKADGAGGARNGAEPAKAVN